MSDRIAPDQLFRYQAAGCRLPASPSPFYAALLELLADDCVAGNSVVLDVMAQTPCTVEAAPALRLLGGAQRCVIDGLAPALAAAWPVRWIAIWLLAALPERLSALMLRRRAALR